MRELTLRPDDGKFALAAYYMFKTVPMLIGAMSIWLGYRLFVLGVSGQASLQVNSKTVSGQLLNAAPGLFFALGGAVAVVSSVWKGVNVTLQGGPGKLGAQFKSLYVEDFQRGEQADSLEKQGNQQA